MDRDLIVKAFRDSITNNDKFRKEIFGDLSVPENIDDIELTLSSLSFVELLIDAEERLGFEFAEDCVTNSKIKISELVKIIEEKHTVV